MTRHYTGNVRWLLSEKIAKFYVFRNPSETGRLVTSESDSSLLTKIYCTCCTDCDDVIIFLLFSGATLVTWVGFLLGCSSISGVNQLFLRSIFSVAPLCEMRCTRYVQFGGILPSLMNVTM